MDADDVLETAAAWERLVAHAQVQQFRALARFRALHAGTDLDEFASCAVLTADPDAADRRHRAARADRRVQLHPHPDGMGALWAMLPADTATAAYTRLDMLARDLRTDDPRGMDARRADILSDLLLGRDPQGRVADAPGELAGYGPVPADMARELAAAAQRWRAGLIDGCTGRFRDLSIA